MEISKPKSSQGGIDLGGKDKVPIPERWKKSKDALLRSGGEGLEEC